MATINYTEFLEAQRAYDEAQCAAVGGTDFGSGAIYSANTQFFLVVMGCVVILMQPGFAMLEAGSTGSTAITSILFKNFTDCLVGAIGWFSLGFAFAFGHSHNQFIGDEGFFTYKVGKCNYAFWFFQLSFATTASTIVSGAIAGRTKLSAYMAYTFVMVCWVYPTVVHWVWGPDPWLTNEGYRDFAGSGVVHCVGGTTALIAAFWVGPRGTAQFETFKTKRDIPGHSMVTLALGAMLLFIGFLGFNGGSVIFIDTVLETQALATAVVNTCLASAGGGLTTQLVNRKLVRQKYWSFTQLCNGAIAGMVSVCAGANAFEPWAAFFTGCVAGVVYRLLCPLVSRLGIDDAVDAGAVHLGGGAWGVIAASLLSNNESVFKDNHGKSAWERLGWAICGVIVIAGWAAVWMNLLFAALHRFDMLRVSDDDVESGLDLVEHGESAYVWTAVTRDSRHPQGPARLAARGMYSIPFPVHQPPPGRAVKGASAPVQPAASPSAEHEHLADGHNSPSGKETAI